MAVEAQTTHTVKFTTGVSINEIIEALSALPNDVDLKNMGVTHGGDQREPYVVGVTLTFRE
jgi:hypothetical protein